MRQGAESSAASLLADIESEITASFRVKEMFLRECARPLADISLAIAEQLAQGGKLLLFGNGGSAADAQHIAAEFVGRYLLERRPLPALALTTNTSTLTAVANDYGYEEVFARQIEALGSAGDAAMGISTGGNSSNVLRGLAVARERRLLTVGFTGAQGGKLRGLCDLCLCVPSASTARIQECHIIAGHIISGYCERVLAVEVAQAASR